MMGGTFEAPASFFHSIGGVLFGYNGSRRKLFAKLLVGETTVGGPISVPNWQDERIWGARLRRRRLLRGRDHRSERNGGSRVGVGRGGSPRGRAHEEPATQ
jgi:hypothetical protein